jgi:hypothetical protein
MGSLPEKSKGPESEPDPGEVLRALRKAIADASGLLMGASAEEYARHLVVGGYLQEQPPLYLVEGTLEILEHGGLGIRSPELQPCSLDVFWNHEQGQINPNIDLSMSIDWTGAPPLWEERAIPTRIIQDKNRPCTDLVVDPESVLRDKERWPLHICEPEFSSQSTARWVEAQSFASDNLNNYRWASMYPLPIGKQALMIRPEMADISAWSEVLGVLPFEEYEQAMWAVRIQYRELVAVHTLDLFGLAEYPDEMHQRLAIPAAGKLAYVVRGHGRRTIDLLEAAERWWAQFRGLTFRGRPPGTGTWSGREDFLRAAKEAAAKTRSDGDKVTQENVAARLLTTDRQLRRWRKDFDVTWTDIRDG